MNSKAVAAVSTPRGQGGISVIRVSGEAALEVCDRIFTPVSCAQKPSEMSGYTCAYGKIYDGSDYIDDCVLTAFRAPRSYTGEDVAEISCHGGIYVTERILQLILKNGARPAEAGEFTRLAFLNGKMDLTEAEAVMDIISAEGTAAHKCAASLREGRLFSSVHKISERLLGLLGELGAWIDYPEEDIPGVEDEALLATLNYAADELNALLSGYDCGKILREGIDTAIVGKPNVGKSTIMNLLSGCERSIVTDIAGTTRDIVEESVRLGDFVLRLSDTAGIHATDDIVESAGVKKAQSKLEAAQLVIAVFDNSEELTGEDIEIAELCNGRNTIAVINKTDCEQRLDCEYIKSRFPICIFISAGSGEGLNELQNVLKKMFNTDSLNYDTGVLANERQRGCVRNALALIKESIAAFKSGVTLDAVNVTLDEAEDCLLELTGEKTTEAVVNEVFSHFCVGK